MESKGNIASIKTVVEYNNSLYTSKGILTGKEFRRMKRKNKNDVRFN